MMPLGSVTGCHDSATGSVTLAPSAGVVAAGATSAADAPGRVSTSGRVDETALRRLQVETRIASAASPRMRSARRRIGNTPNETPEGPRLALGNAVFRMNSEGKNGFPLQ